MADAVEAQVAGDFLQPQRVRQSKIGVPDHAEHRADPPVHHGLRHDVAHGRLMRRLRGDADIEAVASCFDRKQSLASIVMTAGRPPGQRIEIPTMPRAAQPALAVHALLQRAFTQGTALMRTAIVHCGVLAGEMHQRQAGRAGRDGGDAPFRERIGIGNFVPDEIGHPTAPTPP